MADRVCICNSGFGMNLSCAIHGPARGEPTEEEVDAAMRLYYSELQRRMDAGNEAFTNAARRQTMARVLSDFAAHREPSEPVTERINLPGDTFAEAWQVAEYRKKLLAAESRIRSARWKRS